MSPSDLSQSLKPFVFLDLFDDEETSFPGFGWHPHSGIATLTYLWEGSVRYEDTTVAGLPRPCKDESMDEACVPSLAWPHSAPLQASQRSDIVCFARRAGLKVSL
jgi:hypothetical protein